MISFANTSVKLFTGSYYRTLTDGERMKLAIDIFFEEIGPMVTERIAQLENLKARLGRIVGLYKTESLEELQRELTNDLRAINFLLSSPAITKREEAQK